MLARSMVGLTYQMVRTVQLKDRFWLQKAVSMQVSVFINELRVNLIENRMKSAEIGRALENSDSTIISTLTIRSLNANILKRTYDASIQLEVVHLSLSDTTAKGHMWTSWRKKFRNNFHHHR